LQGDCFQETRSYPGEYTLPAGTVHRLTLDVGLWNRERIRRELDAVFRFREQHKVPIACNEFGVFVGGAERASQLRWMRDFTSVLREGELGFSYWNYKNLDFGLVSDGERAYANFPQYKNAERLDAELAAILVESS
jgi:hypothetical protein